MEGNVTELEGRYQLLLSDYQAGRIDETTFLAEVDKLQFTDSWGRYWMLGAQTGVWHYYDGQAWHQADPADADKLPFMDDQGQYWQKGIKSGEWYYYDNTTGEWVKPGEDDPRAPSLGTGAQWAPAYATEQSSGYGYEPPAPAQNQFDTQLFQDDDGRYWALGTKTNQWYFYDETGWHSASDFQAVPSQMPPMQPPGYFNQPQQTQPYYPQAYDSQPIYPQQNQIQQVQQSIPPQQNYPTYQAQQYDPTLVEPQPTQPIYQQPGSGFETAGFDPAALPTENRHVSGERTQSVFPAETSTGQDELAGSEGQASEDAMPSPPQGQSQSGAWYYHDGSQWLKYSSGEPAKNPPPDPSPILEQEEDLKKPQVEEPSEPIVAELYERDEPAVEVVDVEVITVLEAEPEPVSDPVPAPIPEPEPLRPVTQPQPKIDSRPTEAVIPRRSDEVRPRRSRTPSSEMEVARPKQPEPAERPPRRRGVSEPVRPEAPRKRTKSDPNRPVTPRKKAAAPEPTIIIPTESASSNIAPPASPRTNRPTRPPQPDQRRARENTLPMKPIPVNKPKVEPVPVSSGRHRQVTQPLPQIPAAIAAPRPDTSKNRPVQRPKQDVEQKTAAAAGAGAASSAAAKQAQPSKEGYTLGEVLRSFPSTLWTIAGGIVVLVVFAFIFIGIMSIFNSSDPLEASTTVVDLAPTPTLDAGLAPNSTPTPGPTTAAAATESANTPTPVTLVPFSNEDLDITLEYPSDWEIREESDQVIFSPSSDGLISDAIRDVTMRVGIPDDGVSAIADLLAGVLAQFPADAETLNEGTISIASQTWTSTQIRFEDDNLGGQGIATLAVTNKDGTGYYLVAVAPAAAWNSTQPLFQSMINSFKFGAEEIIAQASPQATSESNGATTLTEDEDDEDEEDEIKASPTPKSTPTPEAAATPVVYRVKSGDTLLGIAVQFGVDMELLALENAIESPESLQLEQELIIPFTAEELAAYNATGSAVTSSEDSESDDEDEDAPAAKSESDGGDSSAAAADQAETAAAEPEAETAEEEASAPVPVSGRIVYPAFKQGPNTYDVWMVDLATNEQTPIAGNASQPTFNQDGSLLAYRSWDRGTRGIFFRDFVGGRGGKVTRFVEDGLPTWAPDGYSFAFASRKEGDRVPRVYIGNQLGEDAFGIGFQGEYPSTFPDGRLVVKGCTPTGDCGIFVMGSRGGGEKKISGDPADTAPAVSPDGSKVAFMSSGRGGRNWEIWVMNADGSNPIRLTENGNNDGLPTWSPDGQNIAYVSDQGGAWAVWVMNPDGSNQRKLFDMKGSPDGEVLYDAPNSRGWLEERISWAP